MVKNLPASAGNTEDMGSIPRLERSPGEGNDNPLQYSCLENSRGAGGLQSVGLQRVRHDQVHTHLLCSIMLHENICMYSSVDGHLSCSQFIAFCFEFMDFFLNLF